MNDKMKIVKYQTCNVCNALVRNINSNFKCVSFDLLTGGDILVKFALERITEIERGYIDEIIAEFSAMQESNCVLLPIIETDEKHSPLPYLVYQKGS